MGFFDFLKSNELKKIKELNSIVVEITKKMELKEHDFNNIQKELYEKESNCKVVEEELKSKKADCEKLLDENSHLQERLSLLAKYERIKDVEIEEIRISANIQSKKEDFSIYKNSLENEIAKLEDIKKSLKVEIANKKNEIIQLDNIILLQEFGMYSPIYDFANSEMYKDRLKAIRNKQKNMISNKTAAICSTTWTVNNSFAQGRIMTNQNIKQILRCFNDECEMLISKVKFNNINAYTDKIKKSYEVLNKINSKHDVSISQEYLELKIQELQLAYEYALKKQEEKEERRFIREQMREEAKLMEEIEQRRKEVSKELSHYSRQAMQIEELLLKAPEEDKQHLIERKSFITSRLNELDREIKEMDYREANKKAGYVYIISNIGSFGENVYKIGMTRRLEPMDRIDELGSASVPFKFDVHAMIFSEDAPKLEAALHRAFDSKKVNMVNSRKEFFKVTLEEIESVVKDNFEKSIEFITIPEAEQYRETLKITSLLQ